MNFKKHKDIIIAGSILATSLFFSIVSYASIIEKIEQEIPKLGPIIVGSTYYNIEQNDSCKGRIQVLLEKDKSYHLIIDTILQIKSGNKIFPVKALIEGFFNAIGQLQAGKATLHAAESRFTANTDGVKPIVLNFDANTPVFKKNFTFELPGPVEIIETNPDVFGIRYTNFSGLGAIGTGLKTLGIDNLELKEVANTENDPWCNKDSLTPIEAEQLITKLNAFSGVASPFLNQQMKQFEGRND